MRWLQITLGANFMLAWIAFWAVMGFLAGDLLQYLGV